MKKTKAYYLSEDIDPILWESVSDAYNDLSVYAYHFIAYKSDKYPIPEELIGDAVLMACERAFKFKYRYSYNIEISKLHNWINTIIKRVLIRPALLKQQHASEHSTSRSESDINCHQSLHGT